MYGHNAIWEFTDYLTKNLKKAIELYRELDILGLSFIDNDALLEMKDEIKRRGKR